MTLAPENRTWIYKTDPGELWKRILIMDLAELAKAYELVEEEIHNPRDHEDVEYLYDIRALILGRKNVLEGKEGR